MQQMPRDTRETAHLRDPRDARFSIRWYSPSTETAPWVWRSWIPVWSVPGSEESVQRVLQYPVCLAVVEPGGAVLHGPRRGLSEKVLTGTSWACGVMFRPAAGMRLLRSPVSVLTDGTRPRAEVAMLRSAAAAVRVTMRTEPGNPEVQEEAVRLWEEALAALGEPDEESLLVNDLVHTVYADPSLRRVADICRRFGLSERSLQRLVQRRLGLSPSWLITRRRVQDAAAALGASNATLADVAARLGYADHAHLARDIRAVTGATPTQLRRLLTPPAARAD